MRRKTQFPMIAKAALFAVVLVGGMATGLSITTYTLAKANELVLGQAQPFDSHRPEICRE